MPDFTYTARNISGAVVNGTLSASDRDEALSQLAAKTLFPLSVDAASAGGIVSLFGSKEDAANRPKKLSGAQLGPFYSQLADLIGAGVPLLRALQLIEEQASNPILQEIAADLRTQVADGKQLADAFRRHPQTFPIFVTSLIEAGEEGSFVEDVLRRLADINAHQAELRGKVVGAMIYPTFLMSFGALTVIVMLAYFVPKFEPIFARMEAQGGLPTATVILMTSSGILATWWPALLVAFVAGVIATVRWLKSPNGQRILSRALVAELQVGRQRIGPGLVFRNLAVSRFCRVLGTMLANGVPMLRSLEIAQTAAGNVVIGDAVAKAASDVTEGKSLAQPLRRSGEFAAETVEMIAVGEESNRLEQVLINIADILERRVQRRLDMFVRLIEPIMLLILAAVVTFIVAALLLPILQSSSFA